MFHIRSTIMTLSRMFSIIIVLALYSMNILIAIPMNNIYQTQLFHTIRGTNKFYAPVECIQFSLSLSPFYYHATRASGKSNTPKIAIGNIYGRWNMFGLFYGQDGVPIGKEFKNFENLEAARVKVKDLQNVYPISDFDNLLYNKIDYTDENKYDPERHREEGSYEEVRVSAEHAGLRGEFSVTLPCGLGMNFRGGLHYYRHCPEFFISNVIFVQSGLIDSIPEIEAFKDDSAVYLYDYLIRKKIRDKLAEDIGLDIGEVCATHSEDVHINVFWQNGWPCKNILDDVDCVIAPYLAVGLWLPAGAKKDQLKYFSAPTGNDGFTSITFEGQLNLHFPQMIQLGLGVGFSVPVTTDLREMFVPTHPCQSGIYPWKTHVRVTPGYTWSVNASFKSHMYEHLYFYFDYIYTEHDEDSMRLCETNPTRQAAFEPGLRRLEKFSCWKRQVAHAGLEYEICPSVSLGASITGHITGVRVIRPTETMATIRITF